MLEGGGARLRTRASRACGFFGFFASFRTWRGFAGAARALALAAAFVAFAPTDLPKTASRPSGRIPLSYSKDHVGSKGFPGLRITWGRVPPPNFAQSKRIRERSPHDCDANEP